jgi:hypothetical protein
MYEKPTTKCMDKSIEKVNPRSDNLIFRPYAIWDDYTRYYSKNLLYVINKNIELYIKVN